MTRQLPPEIVPTPRFFSDLVPIPYQTEIWLDPQNQTRWRLEDNRFIRDYSGESEWDEMARYVNKEYSDVFIESYRFALEKHHKYEKLSDE